MPAEDNLKKFNINLPQAPDPVGLYVASKIVGNLVFISGQVSFDSNGKLIKGKIGKELKELDLFFVGIDIIGNYLTEINVTSPTGIKQINKLNNVKLEQVFWDKLEAKYKIV